MTGVRSQLTHQTIRYSRQVAEGGVRISAAPKEEGMSGLLGILISWFPMLLFIGGLDIFMRQMQGGGGKAMGFGKVKRNYFRRSWGALHSTMWQASMRQRRNWKNC
ncbi:MAG: hypothetical protein CM15mP62_08190 [Rhodospirillaceae bacterium]|nr:MAG: hypothetical protein CM15mP62_08190 [Rhodospirillaceae bacterium]